MIPPGMVAEVRRLLTDEGLSQRKVAAVTGVSRGSVSAIASGRRPDYPPRSDPDDDDPPPRGPARRCSGCGGMVYMPCRLCRVRALKERERQSQRHGRPAPSAR